MKPFNGVKIFSASMREQRDQLGETVTRWLEEARRTRKNLQISEILVRQSSDSAFHLVSIIVFFMEGPR